MNAGIPLSYDGNAPSLVPNHQAQGWLSYQAPFGLGAGAGARWMGDRFADDANLAALAGYTLWDAGLWYALGSATYQVGVSNLADLQGHVTGSYGSAGAQLYPGSPRTFKAGLSLQI
jgi:outer membrane receptor for monomeric catechols